jgi:hypothetical protein
VLHYPQTAKVERPDEGERQEVKDKLHVLGLTLILSALIVNSCGPTTPGVSEVLTTMPSELPTDVPTTAPTEVVVEMPDPVGARDAALAYVVAHYPEQAPAPGLIWTEETIMPEGLVGSSSSQYTVEDWVVTVSFPIVAPEATVYQVAMADRSTGFRWEGEVDAAGQVTEQAVVEAPESGIRFSYDDAIVDEVVPQAVPPEELPDAGVIPEHIGLAFSGYVLPDTFHEPYIHIYPVDELEAGWEYAGTIVTELQQLLAEKPAAPETIPFLPVFNAAQMMRTQVAYMGFQNGTGVRFLTQYDQAYIPINNHEMFYTFQGLTSDGKYYVAAILPVSHPSLPADGTEIPGGDWEAFAQNFETYARGVEQQLDVQDASSFTPDLSLLDAMIQSLVAAPASALHPTAEDDPYPGWAGYVNTNYMFAFRYPDTWSLEEEPNLVKLRQGTLLLAIAFQREGEEVPPPWTGMPAGDFESQGTIVFLGQEIETRAVVYEGKVKVLTYGVSVDDLVISIRVDDMTEQSSMAAYEAIEIPEAVQAEVNQIVRSFQILPQ